MKKISSYYLLLIAIGVIAVASCRQIHIYKGETIIVNRSFYMVLNDSVYIFGHTYQVNSNKIPQTNSRVWVEGFPVETRSDSTGFYTLKLKPGKYTITCSGEWRDKSDDAILKDLTVLPNEKLEIDFYLGFTAE